MLVAQVVVDHAPDRGVPGAGDRRYDLDGVLSVEDVIHTAAPADLDRIDLVDIELRGGLGDVCRRETALIVLVGDQVLDGDLLKADVGNKVTKVHQDPPQLQKV